MKFTLKQLLVVTAAISMFFAAATFLLSPFAKFAAANKRQKQRILEELDHDLIRDAVSIFVENSVTGVVDQPSWPDVLEASNPTFVQTAGKMVFVDYGNGFEHFGLIFSFGPTQIEDARRISDGVYYYEDDE